MENKELLITKLDSAAIMIKKQKDIQTILRKRGLSWSSRDFCNSVDIEMEHMKEFGSIQRKLLNISCDSDIQRIIKLRGI